MKIYISGPMSNMPDHNFPAFNEAAEKLTALGYEVENPAEKGIIDGWQWEDYLRYDLRRMLDCDAVATLPGACHSPGARLETDVARALRMPVLTLETLLRLRWSLPL